MEKILAERAEMKAAAKAKPGRGALTLVTPVVAVLSSASSEASPDEEATEALRQPLPRRKKKKKMRRSPEKSQPALE